MIERLELRLLKLPLVHFFETSFSRVYDKHFILVTLDSGGVRGFGECVADVDPFYSAETTTTAWHVLTKYLVPAVVGRTFEHPRDLAGAWPPVRGHRMAKAALEMAVWDLHARHEGRPLCEVLGAAA